MDLSCAEYMERQAPESPQGVEPRPLYAPIDPMMSTDPRIIPNLQVLEKETMPSCDYFKHVQDDIQPFMRKVVTTWMLEVCEEQSCEEQVFPLAVNYLDRVLCIRAIPRHQLQLLASACLLLASKIRQGGVLPVPMLCTYTDNSITQDELRHWEMLVLQLLQWQTYAVTAFDFVEHLLVRTCWNSTRTLMRRHAHTLAALCYTDTDFMHVPPSLTATACLVAAARGLGAGIIADTAASSTAIDFNTDSVIGGTSPVAGTSQISAAIHTSDAPGRSGAGPVSATGNPLTVDGLAAVCALSGSCPMAAERAVRHVELLVARETAPPKSAYRAGAADPPGTPTDVQDVQF